MLDLKPYLGIWLFQRTTESIWPTVDGADYYRLLAGIAAKLDEANVC